MFGTSQESPSKSPPVRTSESPTPCSGYDFHEERVTEQARGPQPPGALALPSWFVPCVCVQAAHMSTSKRPHRQKRCGFVTGCPEDEGRALND